MFKNITWGHAMIIVLITFIIFILLLIYKYKSSNNPFDLVTKKYYQEELIYQNEINAYNRTNKLDSIPFYKITKKGILIIFPKYDSNIKGKILLRHPSKENLDVNLKLFLDLNGYFLIPKKYLKKSIYLLQIKWKKNDLFYRKDYDIKWK